MVWLHGQEAHEVSINHRGGSSGLRDAKRVDRIQANGQPHSCDLFPFQTWIPIDLLPFQFDYFLECIQDTVAFRLVQLKQIFLKSGIVEVEFYEFAWWVA